MKRFILLSFLLLGLAFYELSGGAEFDPQAARQSLIEARTARDADRRADLSAPDLPPAIRAAQPAQPRSDPSSGRAKVEPARPLDLMSFEVAAKRTDGSTGTAQSAPPALPLDSSFEEETDEAPVLATTPPDASIAGLGSIAFPGTTISASSQTATDLRDIRTIKGERVNLRSGPGTDYDIVDQLAQATRVEVLTDNGNGWVELRPVDGGPTGWIAAFLLNGG